jgi:hypothetical protein
MELRDCVKKFGAVGDWVAAAEQFADYWGGAGSWQDMPEDNKKLNKKIK